MQQEKSDQKYILLKHQYYLNFTDFGMEQPTMINVVRDPVTRFSSMYYFNRYAKTNISYMLSEFGAQFRAPLRLKTKSTEIFISDMDLRRWEVKIG